MITRWPQTKTHSFKWFKIGEFTLLYSDFFITNVGLEAEIKTADETRTSDMPWWW